MAASTVDHGFCKHFEWDSGVVTYTDKGGYPHRMNGPAVEIPFDTKLGFCFQVSYRVESQKGPYWGWYFHGLAHRIGGPAKIFGLDHDRVEWWVNGIQFSDEEKEDYEDACIAFCKQHYNAIPGRMTKRAHAN